MTITGSNLAWATTAALNSTPTPIITDSATSVVTQVPADTTAGPITIPTLAWPTTTKHNFVVMA